MRHKRLKLSTILLLGFGLTGLQAQIAPSVTATTPTNDQTPTWNWSTGGGGGNGTFRYKLDDNDLTSGATTTTSFSYTPGTNLTEASHTLYVQERDTAGNWSTSGSFTIVIDITTQSPTLTLPASNSFINKDVEIKFTLPEAAKSGTVKMTFIRPTATDRSVTFTSDFETFGEHTTILNGEDLVNNIHVASGNGNNYLYDSGIYGIKLEYQDLLGNSVSFVTNTNIQYGSTKPTPSFQAISSPRNTRVGIVSLDFDKYVKADQVTWDDFTLTRNGTTNVPLDNSLPFTFTYDYNYSGWYSNTFTLDLTAYNTLTDGSYELTLKETGTGIKDFYGNDLMSGANVIWTMDATPPTLTYVHIQSNNANSAYAKVGDEVTVSFTSNEPIQTPTATINGNVATIAFVSGNSWTVKYSIVNGDTEGDVSFDISLQDLAGNNANVTSVTDGSSVTFLKSAPTILSVSSTVPNGTYKKDDIIPITIIFNKPVFVTGTPRLTIEIMGKIWFCWGVYLETGPIDRDIDFTSVSTNTLTFNYTVQAEDVSCDLNYKTTTSLFLNSGTIKDIAGNDATLILPAVNGLNSLGGQKDIIIGIVPEITTQAVTSVSSTTATGNGNITNLGFPNPIAYGVCWNTTGTPTIADNKVDNGTTFTTGTFTASITSLTPNTTYYVRAYVTNTAGTGYGGEVNFTTQSIPEITWSNPSDIIHGTLLSSTQLNATANVPGTFTYTPAAGTILNTGTAQSLKVDFVPTDAVNYTSTSKTVTINVSRATPEITSVAPTTATEGQTYTYNILATDPEGATLSYNLSGQPTGMEISGNLITWTPGEGVTSSGEVTLTVSDGSLLTTETFTITVTPVNDSPVIISTAPTTATEDETYTYTITATDPEGVTLSYNLSGQPTGMEISGNLITWTPGEGVTSSGEVTLTVSDGSLITTETFTITVTTVNDAPIISSTAPITATEGQTYTYSVLSTDPEGSTLSYLLSSSPAGMTISGNIISWIPGEGVTSDSVSLLVTDGSMMATQSFIITVTSVNDAPVICLSQLSTTEDTPIAKLLATDIDSDSISCTFLASAVNGTTNTINDSLVYSPNMNFYGNDSLQAVVSDGFLTDTTWVYITVTPVNDAPVVIDTVINVFTATTVNIAPPALDIDGAISQVFIDMYPANGTAMVMDTVLIYISDTGFIGNDTIKWFAKDNGGLYSSTAMLVITVTAKPTYTITASAGSGGSINPSGAISVEEGNNQIFIITADTGYIVNDVLVDGTSVGNVEIYTFNSVITNHTIEASFIIESGIDDIQANDIRLYPNPCSAGFYIYAGEKIHTLYIYDITGKPVYMQQSVGTSYVDTENLKAGIYIVKVNKKTYKLVKE